MNVHDSERMAGLMSEAGYVPVSDPASASVILVNTCTVRDKADQKALSDLGRLRQLKKGHPETILAVTGCMAEREQGNLHRLMPEIDLIAGPSQVRNLLPMLSDVRSSKKVLLGREYDLPEMTTPPAIRATGVSALVTVQEGCDKACAYCVVPTTRGGERSRPVSAIVEEVTELVSSGYREVTLLGQNVNGFGKNRPAGRSSGEESFGTLLRALNGIGGLLRIRFTTSHPSDMSEDMINAMRECGKVMPHFHLPIQSGSDPVLGRMQRGYTVAQYREWASILRNSIPEVSLTTDLIVGFCGETEEEFSKTLDAVEEFRFDGAFCFIYSPRPGTPAWEWEDIPSRDVSVSRFRRLEERIDQMVLGKNRDRIGVVEEVLVDRADSENGRIGGRTPHFRQVRGIVPEGRAFPVPGEIVSVRISSCSKAGMEGVLV
jgi:tRNA-2-methylthio-N6-dimethylallyladenosine synthase